VYDLSVDFFPGMPSFTHFGDPPFQYWMTKTPRGVINDKLSILQGRNDENATWSGDAFLMYTHTGTHIDAYNHFCLGTDFSTYGGFKADDYLGDQGWQVAGADSFPPVIARGVLLDVASAKHLEMLPPSYGISRADLEETARLQGVELRKGDVALIRTGRMRAWPDPAKFCTNEPGLTLEGAVYLAEEKKAMIVGADNLSLEQWPSSDPSNPVPVHSYLLVKRGVPILEVLMLEELAKDKIWEFAFIGAPLKIRGATGSPLRPVALPIRN
jgi:kynurenine formamidase